MLIPTIVVGLIAIILLFIGYYKGEAQHIEGIRSAWNMLVPILPLLVFAFIVAGMLQVLIPREIVSNWLGPESGMRGIFVGAGAGALMHGGPYVVMPVAAGFLRAGAGVGTIVAFITGWSLWAISRLPIELGILGWKFWLIRIAATFFFPPIAGLIAQTFFGKWI